MLYWARLLSGNQDTFLNVFYRLSRKLNEHGYSNLNCAYFIKKILNERIFTYMGNRKCELKEWVKCVNC